MQHEFLDLQYVFFRVLFIASRASQLVVQLVEVFNSSLVAAHSQLKVCMCHFLEASTYMYDRSFITQHCRFLSLSDNLIFTSGFLRSTKTEKV